MRWLSDGLKSTLLPPNNIESIKKGWKILKDEDVIDQN